MTLDTLRHSFASVAGDLGYAEATIGALLGHVAGTVTGRYTHVLDAVLIAAADHVATTVQDYMTGECCTEAVGAWQGCENNSAQTRRT